MQSRRMVEDFHQPRRGAKGAKRTGSNRLSACTVQTWTYHLELIICMQKHDGDILAPEVRVTSCLYHQGRNDLSELGQAFHFGTAQLQLSGTSVVPLGHLLMARHHLSREAGWSFTTHFCTCIVWQFYFCIWKQTSFFRKQEIRTYNI